MRQTFTGLGPACRQAGVRPPKAAKNPCPVPYRA